MIGEVVELFGKNIAFSDEKDDGVTVTVYTDEMSAEQFAKTYIPDVVVLEPQKLADKVRNSIKDMLLKYQENSGNGGRQSEGKSENPQVLR